MPCRLLIKVERRRTIAVSSGVEAPVSTPGYAMINTIADDLVATSFAADYTIVDQLEARLDNLADSRRACARGARVPA